MADTFFSLRFARSAASLSSVSPPGRRDAEITTRSEASAVAAMASTPPASRVTGRASPPAAGSSQSWPDSSSASPSESGRADTNRMSPLAVNAAPASPLADLVSRRGVPPPCAGTAHSARS